MDTNDASMNKEDGYMARVELITGNEAVAHGVRLSRTEVIATYPITPQTTIIEELAKFVSKGELNSRFINVESEHSAASVCQGSALAGVRTFTTTCSLGLAYMYEPLSFFHEYRLPVVMAITNRPLPFGGLAADYSDSMSIRDFGFIQFFVESNQEALDTIIQAYKIAEDPRILLPVMVNLDGCFLSFSSEVVSIPDQKEVDQFLPAYSPPEIILDPDHPTAEWYLVELSILREKSIEETMMQARQVIEETGSDFEKIFGRKWGLIDEYRCEDAQVVLVTLGSAACTAREVVNEFRAQGEDVGLLKLRTFRPFPEEEILRISQNAEVIVVLDRNVSHGSGGGCGIVYSEVRSTLYDLEKRPKVMSFVAGTGGLDISEDMLRDMAKQALQTAKSSQKRIRSRTNWVLPDLEKVPQSQPVIPKKAQEKLIYPGLQTCAGCGGVLLFRTAVEMIGRDHVMILPFCCVDVGLISMYGDFSPIKVPAFFPCVFAGTASVSTGVRAGLDRRGKMDTLVVGFAGDGGTVDIGLQSLSGAASRGEPILYICYDNEAYMNTGIQRSGSTPYGAVTATTPASQKGKDNPTPLPKDMARIMAAHDIPYVATASVAFLKDYKSKLLKAAQIVKNRQGMAYIHAHSPCPPGWGFPASKTIEVARLAIQTGMWRLYEIENGKYHYTKTSLEPKSLSEYIKAQGRFSHLTDEQISLLEAQATNKP
jgi:pyruvate ferredoxin oxidoreductase alpha subunit